MAPCAAARARAKSDSDSFDVSITGKTLRVRRRSQRAVISFGSRSAMGAKSSCPYVTEHKLESCALIPVRTYRTAITLTESWDLRFLPLRGMRSVPKRGSVGSAVPIKALVMDRRPKLPQYHVSFLSRI